MAKINNRQIRCHPDLGSIINFIRAKYIMEGKKPPTNTKITKIIAEQINQEELLKNVFIRF